MSPARLIERTIAVWRVARKKKTRKSVRKLELNSFDELHRRADAALTLPPAVTGRGERSLSRFEITSWGMSTAGKGEDREEEGDDNCQPPVKNRGDQRNVNSTALAHKHPAQRKVSPLVSGTGAHKTRRIKAFATKKGEKNIDTSYNWRRGDELCAFGSAARRVSARIKTRKGERGCK